ncbi:MAG: hypothetical protein QM831_26490 [Kofleriaceae bacterium]
MLWRPIVVLGALVRVAAADPPAEPLVPKGSGWACFEWSANNQTRGACDRDAAECAVARTKNATAFPSATRSACSTQKDATVVGFHDRMKGWRTEVMPRAAECDARHEQLSHDPDIDHLSNCTTTGDVSPQPPPPARAAISEVINGVDFAPLWAQVPGGEVWHCIDHGPNRPCIREANDCESALWSGNGYFPRDAKCVTATTANVFLSFDGKSADLGVYATQELCDQARMAKAKTAVVTACRSVGPIERAPLDRKLVPAGMGWFCLWSTAGSSCHRTRTECEAVRTKLSNLSDAVVASSCERAATGYGFMLDPIVVTKDKPQSMTVMSSLEECASYVKLGTFSRCEALP